MTLASDLANTHRNIAFNDEARKRAAKAGSDALLAAQLKADQICGRSRAAYLAKHGLDA